MSDYNAITMATSNTRYANSDGKSYALGERTLYANTVNGKRYYSSIDAEIYFGETYIDDVVQISWSIEQATMPLYGYNSYTFDDIAVGARQINGSFMINFTKSGFMYDVLSKVQSVSRSSLYTDNNATYQLAWSSYNEKEHMPGWNRSFNIVVGYGDYAQNGESNSVTVLRCVQLTGCQQVLGVDGGPIGEIYSFIAKDVRNDIGALPEVNVVKEDKNDNENEEDAAFVFSVKSASVDYDLSIIDPRLFAGRMKFNLKYKSQNGNVTGISLALKSHQCKSISSSTYNIGVGSDYSIAHFLSTSLHDAIIESFKIQKEKGVNDNEAFLYYDLTINYEVENVPAALSLPNQKVFINEVNVAQ